MTKLLPIVNYFTSLSFASNGLATRNPTSSLAASSLSFGAISNSSGSCKLSRPKRKFAVQSLSVFCLCNDEYFEKLQDFNLNYCTTGFQIEQVLPCALRTFIIDLPCLKVCCYIV